MKLRDILDLLKRIYCGKIGVEVAHVSKARERLWLRKRFEQGVVGPGFSDGKRHWLLEQLTAAEGIERYLHTRYVGQKRFSLEGGESLIPMLDELIQAGGRSGVNELVIGMAHRGRINVLVNVLGKSPEELFEEFEGNVDPKEMKGSGDVKYHKGFSADMKTKAAMCISRWRSIRHTSRSSIRSSKARCAPVSSGAAISSDRKCCRYWCMAMLRSRDRGSSPRRSRCHRRTASAPVARSTSSSTTRSVSRRAARPTLARRPIAVMSPR